MKSDIIFHVFIGQDVRIVHIDWIDLARSHLIIVWIASAV